MQLLYYLFILSISVTSVGFFLKKAKNKSVLCRYAGNGKWCNRVLQMGLFNPDLYGTNKNVGNISQNAAYDNSKGDSKAELGNKWFK